MTGQSGGSRHLRPRLSHALIHMRRELGEILDEHTSIKIFPAKQFVTPEYAAVANYAYHLDAGRFACRASSSTVPGFGPLCTKRR